VSFSSQVKGISQGCSVLLWLGGFFLCFFPVDSEEILLPLGRQNPALTHFQLLSIEWFVRKTGMVHIKMSIFSSCFLVLVIIPVWILY